MPRPDHRFIGVDMDIDRRRRYRPKQHPHHDECDENREDDLAFGSRGYDALSSLYGAMCEVGHPSWGSVRGVAPRSEHHYSRQQAFDRRIEAAMADLL